MFTNSSVLVWLQVSRSRRGRAAQADRAAASPGAGPESHTTRSPSSSYWS